MWRERCARRATGCRNRSAIPTSTASCCKLHARAHAERGAGIPLLVLCIAAAGTVCRHGHGSVAIWALIHAHLLWRPRSSWRGAARAHAKPHEHRPASAPAISWSRISSAASAGPGSPALGCDACQRRPVSRWSRRSCCCWRWRRPRSSLVAARRAARDLRPAGGGLCLIPPSSSGCRSRRSWSGC